jgi:hypothetical protein
MILHLVQATMHGREYTHYTCRTRTAADRLALVLAEKRPNLAPISVVEWEPTPEQAARIHRFADDSPGPK